MSDPVTYEVDHLLFQLRRARVSLSEDDECLWPDQPLIVGCPYDCHFGDGGMLTECGFDLQR